MSSFPGNALATQALRSLQHIIFHVTTSPNHFASHNMTSQPTTAHNHIGSQAHNFPSQPVASHHIISHQITSRHMTAHHITWHRTWHHVNSHDMTWHLATNHITVPHLTSHVTSQPTAYLLHLAIIPHHIAAHHITTANTTTHHRNTNQPPKKNRRNGWKNPVWALHWLVALRAPYRQILPLADRFLFPGPKLLAPQLALELLVQACLGPLLYPGISSNPRDSSRCVPSPERGIGSMGDSGNRSLDYGTYMFWNPAIKVLVQSIAATWLHWGT